MPTVCRGLMVFENLLSKTESDAVYGFDGWRCVVCGEVLDWIILKNRSRVVEPDREMDEEWAIQ